MRRLLALALTLLALPLAACGGDGDSGSGNSSAKDDFIAKGDAICEDVNEQINEINLKLGAISGKGSVNEQFEASEALLSESVEVQEEAIADFRALEVPEEDSEIIEEYLDTADDQRGALAAVAEGAANKDKEAVEKASASLEPIGGKRQQLARDYGFEKCGGGE